MKNTKIIFIAIIFLGLFGLAKESYAACSGASPNWTAASASQADIADCASTLMCTDGTGACTTLGARCKWGGTCDKGALFCSDGSGSCSASGSACGNGGTCIGHYNPDLKEGDTVNLPAGTFHWTSNLVLQTPANITLRGAGTTQTGGGDQTVIVDDVASNSVPFSIQVPATGTFRMTGITIRGGSGAAKDHGMIGIWGPGTVRLDHLHLDSQSYSPPKGNKIIVLGDRVYGVLDHSILDLYSASAIYLYNGWGDSGMGNEVWAQDTNFGGSNFFYIEDNVINGTPATHDTRIYDCMTGGRVVARFNTLTSSCAGEVHATGSSSDTRGCRAQEVYGNVLNSTPGQEIPNFDISDTGSGAALYWYNQSVGATMIGYHFNVTRKNDNTYSEGPTPIAWGFCGDYFSGTVNTNGTAVTWVSGKQFRFTNTNGGTSQIPAGSKVRINGIDYTAASDATATSLTLTTSAGDQTGVPYTIHTDWDQNSDASTGYACIDQPGRGKGDLITGSFPNKVNSVTGTIAWPHQALEPMYFWGTVFTAVRGWGNDSSDLYTSDTGGRVAPNRDYYPQASGIQTSPTTPFDGTSGTGWGTLANRPTHCTSSSEAGGGVGYFATDQGSWNTSSSNPYGIQQNGADGVLYKCTATDTWTPYYTPYTYPHPLQGNSETDITPPSAPSGLTVK